MNKNSEYINHFNQQSDQYSLCRPDYPEALFDYLATQVDANAQVWDCGTGNGQAAKALASRFQQIFATDINAGQLEVATRMANIEYYCCPADKTPLKPGTINLITVAQALHWFNFDDFYEEVRRVSAENALFFAWCYSLGYFNEPAIDEPIRHLYYEILGKHYWPRERFYIDEEYKTIPCPFIREATPSFSIEKGFNLPQLMGYLATWSAVKEYQKHQNHNPLDLIATQLATAWGEPSHERLIHWPLHCLSARVNKF
ncbi:class I SAM-dependent methyltransferase [Legionella sp. km772]|uniref:class I SAM-dependent methyltransferase n=1 Tax=Legionella sp. km772 TaxID=2498111 RepID=UPI00131591D2|nr:class I SAM-dependent methyltransferase [Legionella sp. km772]